MKLTKKAKTHFTFVSKPNLDLPGLMVRNLFFRNVGAELKQLSWTKMQRPLLSMASKGPILLGASVWMQGQILSL